MGEFMFSFKRKKLEVSSEQLNSLYVNYDEKRFNVYNDFVKANQEEGRSTNIFLSTGKTITVSCDGCMELDDLGLVRVVNHNPDCEWESIFPLRAVVCVESWF